MSASFAVLPVDVSGDSWNFSHSSTSSETIRDNKIHGNADPRPKSKRKRRKRKATVDAKGDRSTIECVEVRLDESEISRLMMAPLSAELRQRNVKVGNGCNEFVESEGATRESSVGDWKPPSHDHCPSLSNQGSMDWKKVMAEYPGILEDTSSFKNSPLAYLLAEINSGNTLRSTISVGIERKRQGVYNTMFYVPLRCELLIDVGFFVCLDTFLSLLTIMPARIVMIIWRFLKTRRINSGPTTGLAV